MGYGVRSLMKQQEYKGLGFFAFIVRLGQVPRESTRIQLSPSRSAGSILTRPSFETLIWCLLGSRLVALLTKKWG